MKFIFLILERVHFENLIRAISLVNSQAPVAQKVADEVVFRRFQGEEVEFFKSDLYDPPPSDFKCASFEDSNSSPSRFHF